MIKIDRVIIPIVLVFSFLFLFFLTRDNDAKAIEKKESNSNNIFVDIKGAVKNPGVYEIKNNSRIIDVIKAAGDLTKDADTSTINLSKKVKDEMYIIIYTKDEISAYKDNNSSSKINEEINKEIVCPDGDNDACLKSNSGKININTASLDELLLLDGIGKGKAQKIIAYREKNKFNTIEDIKNVSGIGKSLYEKIKDNIEV